MRSEGTATPAGSRPASSGRGPEAFARVWATPFDVVSHAQRPEAACKRDLLQLSHTLEREALAGRCGAVAACLQDVRYLTARTRATYRAIAATGARPVVFGRDVPAYVTDGVAGIALDDADPLVDDWAVLLHSPGGAVVLAATDLHDPEDADDERRFLVAVSRDQDVVAACLDVLAVRQVSVPGDLDAIAERLTAEFAGRAPVETVTAVVRSAARDLSGGTPPTAWPELLERSARQRLLDLHGERGPDAQRTPSQALQDDCL